MFNKPTTGSVFATLSFLLTNGPNKLEYYITLGRKGLLWTNTLAFWGLLVHNEENEVL